MRTPRINARKTLLSVTVLSCLWALTDPVVASAQPAVQAQSWDVAAGPLDQALRHLMLQGKLTISYPPELLAGKTTRGVSGQHAPVEALRRLLDGTGLAIDALNETTYVLRAASNARSREEAGQVRPSSASRRSQASLDDEKIVGMPAIMVEGARTLNMDITRTRDDPQPYVVFDRDVIERSGATNLEQFLQQRLPMNTSVASMGSAAQMTNYNPSSSSVNLRGLGAGQTLILVDGHRMSSPMIRGATSQGDISGIPLAAVERIEILPSTASGIYGGSATGGVINVITRKDYSGGEVRVTYDNTFSTDSAVRKLDFVFGHNFNQGRTNMMLSAGYSDANTLDEADRGFLSRGRAHARHHNPDYDLLLPSPPVGRRPNFISEDGSDLVLKSGVALGSPYASVPAGYMGVAVDGGAALAANAGKYDWSLPDGGAGLGRVLYTEPMLKSGGLVLRHRFGEGLQAFVDLSSSESRRKHREVVDIDNVIFSLPADSIYNPFTTAIQGIAPSPVREDNRSSIKNERAVVGVIKQLSSEWQMSLDYTWDRTQMNAVVPARFLVELPEEINAGGVDILRDLDIHPIDVGGYSSLGNVISSQSTMKNASIRFSGPLGSLPGGRPVFSGAVAHRDERIPDSLWLLRDFGADFFYASRSASVSSVYMEYRVPLFSDQNARPALRELELQLAARYEEYISRSAGLMRFVGGAPSPLPEPDRARNGFSSLDPTFALRWVPIPGLAVRMSYGTGFMPPSLDQMAPYHYNGDLSWVMDPRRGNTSVGRADIVWGGNPDLRPEQSKSWSAGLVFTPEALPGLRFSLDYTRIEKTDNIGLIPNFGQGVVDNESLFPQLVVRGPNLPDDPPGWAGPIVQVDTSPLNLASLELEAWDFQLDYRLETQERGAFDLFVVGTWQPRYAISVISGEPMLNYVGLGAQNPLEFKAGVGMTWSLSAWRAGWNTSYFDSYMVNRNISVGEQVAVISQGNGGRVSSQAYHDAFVSYDFAMSSSSSVPSWLSGTQVQLGIRNLFNKRPPVDMGTEWGHAYYSPFGSPRLASYYLTVTTRF